jgi:IrrE N-terminal-like domain
MNRAASTVRVREDLSPAEACSTLAPELAHIELGHGDQACTDPRSRREVEAESVAYVVAMAAGLDTSGYSLPYVAGWAESGKEAEVMAETADRVIETARRFLAALPHQAPDQLGACHAATVCCVMTCDPSETTPVSAPMTPVIAPIIASAPTSTFLLHLIRWQAERLLWLRGERVRGRSDMASGATIVSSKLLPWTNSDPRLPVADQQP